MKMTLASVLQNFLMHIALAAKAKSKVYDTLVDIGPQTSAYGTLFHSRLVDSVDIYRQTEEAKKAPSQDPVVVWKASESANAYHNSRPQATRKAPMQNDLQGNTMQSQYNGSLKCHNCGQQGHVRKDCRICGFCKKQGHKTKYCKLRLAASKGKNCSYCHRENSHTADECFRNPDAVRNRPAAKNVVRTVTHTDANSDSEWTSPNFDGDDTAVAEAAKLC